MENVMMIPGPGLRESMNGISLGQTGVNQTIKDKKNATIKPKA